MIDMLFGMFIASLIWFVLFINYRMYVMNLLSRDEKYIEEYERLLKQSLELTSRLCDERVDK